MSAGAAAPSEHYKRRDIAPRGEIRSHTALRGLAALLVVVFHYKSNIIAHFPIDDRTLMIESFDGFVDQFFILSGFVLAYTYAGIFDAGAPRGAIRDFLINRLARIYPLHLATLAIMVALSLPNLAAVTGQGGRILENVVMIHAWGVESRYALNFPSWSISGEWAAYLVFPLVIGLSRARGFAVGAVLLAAAGYGGFWALQDLAGVPAERLNLLRAIPAFTLGVALYRQRDLVRDLWPAALSGLQLLCLVALAWLMHLGADKALLLPFMAGLALLTWTDRGMLARLLGGRALAWLGALSYSIYMLHVPVRAVGYQVWPHLAPPIADSPISALAFTATCLVVTVAVSALCFAWFETPARRMIRGLAAPRAATA
jgi:peptidoglycan/LPS O-acetylase OafA/YrhL